MEMDNKSGSASYITKVCFVAALGGLLFGYDTAIIAGAIPFLTPHFQLNDIMLGWAVSSVLIGCIVGAASAGSISDKFGRKKILLSCAVLFAVSAIWSG
jgi:SP family arabinose:H+ symporter-like MFS transporter